MTSTEASPLHVPLEASLPVLARREPLSRPILHDDLPDRLMASSRLFLCGGVPSKRVPGREIFIALRSYDD